MKADVNTRLILDKQYPGGVQFAHGALVDLVAGAEERVQVDAARQRGEGRCLLRRDPADELPHVVPACEAQFACQLAIHRVFYHHVQHCTAVIHHDVQFPFHVRQRIVYAGDGAAQAAAATFRDVAARRCCDIGAGSAQQRDVSDYDLAADAQL